MSGVVHKAGHAYSSDLPMTNIRKEPCGGWMIVLFIVMSFIIECVDQMCRSFFQDVSLFFWLFVCLFFSNHCFWPCCYGFLTFTCLWEICFFSQKIVELLVGYWA